MMEMPDKIWAWRNQSGDVYTTEWADRPGCPEDSPYLRATPERIAAKDLLEAHVQMNEAATLAIALIPDVASPVRAFLEAIISHSDAAIAKAGGQG